MRDRHDLNIDVDSFGVEATIDAVRVVRNGDQISFFGSLTAARHFCISLPTEREAIHFRWVDRRLTRGGMYGMSAKVFKMSSVDTDDEELHGSSIEYYI